MMSIVFFFQAEDGIRAGRVTGVQTCALPICAMYLAALLFKDIRFDPRVMGAEVALEMATIRGARALGLQHEIGSLEPGKKADLVLFDADTPQWQPLYCEPYNLVYSASGDSADTVIVDGKIVMENREVKTIDEREVIAR